MNMDIHTTVMFNCIRVSEYVVIFTCCIVFSEWIEGKRETK